MLFKFASCGPHTHAHSYVFSLPYYYILLIFFSFLCVCVFLVLCPLSADLAFCRMLVVMSQFECSQTVSRTMGIQVNKGKVNPLTHNHPSSPSSPTDSLPHYSPTSTHGFHSTVQMRWALSGREWATSTNTVAEASRERFRCLCSSILFF